MSNIRFDAFVTDEDDNSSEGDVLPAEDAYVTQDSDLVDETPDDSLLSEEERKHKGTMKRIKKGLSTVPTRITEIIKTPPSAWLAVCLLVMLQTAGVTGSMLGLLRTARGLQPSS